MASSGHTQPLIEGGAPEARVSSRLRLLRFLIGGFAVCIVVAAVVTAERLMHIAGAQKYVDTSYPACRKGYVLGVLPAKGSMPAKLVLWSGKADSNCALNELCDDMWTFDASKDAPTNATSKWRRVRAASEGKWVTRPEKYPEPRWKTSAVQDAADDMYVFAGDPLRSDGSYIDDVWKLSSASLEWTRMRTVCNEPKKKEVGEPACLSLDRRAHDAALLGSTMYVYGGKDPSSDLLNDVWALELGSLEWERLWLVGARGTRAGGRAEGWAPRGRLRARPGVRAALRALAAQALAPSPAIRRAALPPALGRAARLRAARRPQANAVEIKKHLVPPSRKGHTLVPVEAMRSNFSGKAEPAIVLFGGRVNIKHYFNDAWAFFPSRRVWEPLDAAKGGFASTELAPHPRDHHAAAVVGDGMYVCCGWFEYWHAFDDMWRFDLVRHSWAQLDATAGGAPKPAGRFLVSIVPVGTDLYVFGGEAGADAVPANAYLNDLWVFDTTSSTWKLLSENRCPRDHSIKERPATSAATDDEDDDGSRRRRRR